MKSHFEDSSNRYGILCGSYWRLRASIRTDPKEVTCDKCKVILFNRRGKQDG